MLEKIGTPGFEMLSMPNKSVLKYLDYILLYNDSEYPVFYEIGVGIGATTLPVARRMSNKGKIFLFSLKKDVDELTSDLLECGYKNIDSNWGSPNNTYSGYHFELACGVVEKQLPNFDLAYIDGGHVFHLDAPATCVLKELCKVGGYMIFDDYYWSLAKSPTLNPKKRPLTTKEYDSRQIETCHVQLVCHCLMDTDSRFQPLGIEGGTAVYQRIV